ncbi:MAG: prolipoprotein diacylglyceryl transferase [Parachlamydiales bacterium]
MLASLFWDPDPVFIQLPLLGRPLVWYGVLFALGFFLSFLRSKRLLVSRMAEGGVKDFKRGASLYADRLLWAVVIGTLIGARLGHILFYDLAYYRAHPGEIIAIWHGGLASHGGVVGILAALLVFQWRVGRRYPVSFLRLVDLMAVSVPIACLFIRLGNFVNQEILGTPTALPWAVIFGHPADRSIPEPRHPVQLYEALAYLGVFVLLYLAYRRPPIRNREGCAAGLFFSLTFASRFLLEMVKEPYTSGALNTGQWLSIPFILGGVALAVWAGRKKARKVSS